MDYSVFDALLDSLIVIAEDGRIVYCNEPAAKFLQSSVRRLTKSGIFQDIVQFNEGQLFPMPGGDVGRQGPSPYMEIEYQFKNGSQKGRIQTQVRPFHAEGQARWIILIRDVTLEEVLHGKYRAELEQKEHYIVELQQAQKQLEAYSKNLEKMVEARTAELRAANQMLSAIMNSLGQGFLAFDQMGQCGSVYTKACLDVLEAEPAGKKVWDILRVPQNELKPFVSWLEATFSEKLPFASMKELAPQIFAHSKGKYVTLDYFPIRQDDEKISNLVLVATDKTIEHEAGLALEKERHFAQMVVKFAKNKDQFIQFVKSIAVTLNKLGEGARHPAEKVDFAEAFRLLHTLEGEAGAFSIQDVRSQARRAQEIIEPVKEGSWPADQELAERYRQCLKDLKLAYEEFLLVNQKLFGRSILHAEKTAEISVESLQEFSRKLARSRSAQKLRDIFNNEFLKQELKNSLIHYNEVIQLVAEKQGKCVSNLQFDCEGVRIFPQLYEGLFASLVHAFRNAVDHGIEAPEERQSAGKTEHGQIWIRAKYFSKKKQRYIRIEVQDDGRGIDPAVIRSKLQEKFPDRDFSRESDEEVIQNIFLPGFSSRDEVGEFSGRGIGMDAISSEVKKLKGTVLVTSQIGQGSILTLEVPELEPQEEFALSA